MEIDIETRDVHLPKNSRGRLKTRISKRVGHLASRVLYLRVTLADVNGKKGGKDKVCKLAVRLRKGGQIIVTHKSHSVARALFEALHRLRRLLSKQRRAPRLKKTMRLAEGTEFAT